MPLYEFYCKKCGQLFDKLLRLSQADMQVRCPRCDSEETERQLSTFATGATGSCGAASSRFR